VTDVSWLISVARSYLINQQRRQRLQQLLRGHITPTNTSPQLNEATSAARVVYAVLDQMTGADREILTLHAWEQLTGDDLARAMRYSPKKTAHRLTRAQERFRDLWDTNDGWAIADPHDTRLLNRAPVETLAFSK
jgi:RNA polymerase sigma-70 factor (ECF subfamily)